MSLNDGIMLVSSKSRLKNQRAAKLVRRSLGFDFAVLGLRANECRLSVIRTAAQRVADRISESVLSDSENEAMRSQLAVSTYRLLDPRLRSRTMERIQLSIFSEDDFERQRCARRPLVELSKPNMVKAQLVPVASEQRCA